MSPTFRLFHLQFSRHGGLGWRLENFKVEITWSTTIFHQTRKSFQVGKQLWKFKERRERAIRRSFKGRTEGHSEQSPNKKTEAISVSIFLLRQRCTYFKEKESNFRKICEKKKMLQSRICCFFLILMLLMVDSSEGSRRLSVETQDIEVQKLLNQLNKPPVKTIKIPDGDIIDCIHMSHQPAFDHPLLKNHTIQKIPNYHPESVFGINKTSDLETDAKLSTQGLQLFGRCPEGTIPNRRVKREDLFRASSFKGFGQKKHGSIPKPMSTSPDTQTGLQHEVAYVEGGRYYGAKAAINVWQPQIQKPNGLSLSQIWVLGGSPNSDFDSIEAGWQVSHDLYGDYNTRFFISRTDPKSGNWWLHFGGEPVGYWPAVLFSDLNNGASMVAWGGEVANSESKESTTITQMGSGCFPDEGYSGASYFRDFRVVDDSNNLIAPEDVQSFTKHSECYDVKLQKEVDWGNAIYYGGPGCP